MRRLIGPVIVAAGLYGPLLILIACAALRAR
jgi:hypothetical protein